MSYSTERQAIDLSQFPELVVIYLGMRVRSPRGALTLLRFGRRIRKAVRDRPDGLLLHEDLMYTRRMLGMIPTILPMHHGMRQYWRDFESLERWSRSGTHAAWWREMVQNPRGTGFWHEAYCRSGEMEGVSINMPEPVGMMCFAGMRPARGAMFSARQRLRRPGEATVEPPIPERELPAGRARWRL